MLTADGRQMQSLILSGHGYTFSGCSLLENPLSMFSNSLTIKLIKYASADDTAAPTNTGETCSEFLFICSMISLSCRMNLSFKTSAFLSIISPTLPIVASLSTELKVTYSMPIFPTPIKSSGMRTFSSASRITRSAPRAIVQSPNSNMTLSRIALRSSLPLSLTVSTPSATINAKSKVGIFFSNAGKSAICSMLCA